MRAHHASRTAEYMALFRALETARPAQRRLFEDRWAAHFLDGPLHLVAKLARLPRVAEALAWLIDRRWPGARSSGVARTRLIDDALVAALGEGGRSRAIAQVVLLGAGFDARAYRLAALAGVPVIEVDHPATGAAKRARLGPEALARGQVRFAAIDFAHQQLGDVLVPPLYDPALPSFFVWEGVTNYLDEPAVDATLRFVAGAAPGSELLFTYVDRALLTEPERFHGADSAGRVVRAAGEPWTFGLDPAELPAYLAARGLALDWDLGAADYRARYFGPAAAARLRGYEFYHAALATVR
jgi:methyltransferase (TIGR00027 family)